MSSKNQPLRDALAVLARRELFGAEHPSAGRRLAYQRGEIPPAEITGITNHLSLCAECAAFVLDAAEFFGDDALRILADLAAFPDVEPAPGTPELADEEVAARWALFCERLGRGPR